MIAVAHVWLDVVTCDGLEDLVRGDAVRLPVDHEHDVRPFGSRLPGRLASLGRQGVTTPGTVVVVAGDAFEAVPTGPPLGRLVLVGFGDTDALPDGLVVLLAGDVLIDAPHVGVDGPVDAVFDLGAVPALATHPRNRGVTEVVGVHRLVDADAVGGLPQLPADGTRRDRAVLVLVDVVPVTRDGVEERDVIAIGAWVQAVEIGPQGRLRVDDRVRADVRTLQPRRVRVRSERRPVGLEVDVADAQRPDEREAGAGVRKELDHGDVAEVVRTLAEGVDVRVEEHVVRGEAILARFDQLDLFSPGEIVVGVAVGHREELPDDELVISDGAIGEAGIGTLSVLVGVSQLEDELVVLVLGELDERAIETAGIPTEVFEVLRQRGSLDATVELADEPLDMGPIHPVVLVESVEFVLQTLIESLKVIQIAHTPLFDGVIMNLGQGKITFLDATAPQESTKTTVSNTVFDHSVSADIETVGQNGGVSA